MYEEAVELYGATPEGDVFSPFFSRIHVVI
jgi:hypothetical protein